MILGVSLCAQDLHYTNYEFAPLYLNPAKTGGFNGSLRAGGTYRDQFRTFIDEAYQSTGLWADSPIAFGFNEKQWIGIGANLYTDKTGDLGFGQSGALASLAYHISLDDKYEKVIGIGVQFGAVQKTVGNPDNARFADQNNSSPDLSLIGNFNESYTDLNVGINFKQKISNYNSYEFGASLYHINKPQYFFTNSSYPNRLDNRLNIYLTTEMKLSKKFQLEPGVFYSLMGQAQVLQIQCNSKTLLKKNGKVLLTAGLGYRVADAIQFMIGGVYQSWQFGLSYDMTVSSAASYTNTVGGLEFGVKKYFMFHKKPEIKVIQICPRV